MNRSNTYRGGVLFQDPRAASTMSIGVRLLTSPAPLSERAEIFRRSLSTVLCTVPSCEGANFQSACNCLIVSLGPGAFNCQGFGVSLRM